MSLHCLLLYYFLPPFVLYKLLIQGNPYFKFRILLLPPLSGQTGMSRAYLEWPPVILGSSYRKTCGPIESVLLSHFIFPFHKYLSSF